LSRINSVELDDGTHLRDERMIVDNAQQLRDGVRRAYSAAAKSPQDKHSFPVGRRFAESVGYPRDLLDRLPSLSVDAFSGVSNVSIFAQISAGAIVLDLGCGAGLDSLIAAQRVGPQGRVIGIDFSEAMLLRAKEAAGEAGVENVEFHEAGAEDLPIEGGSIDVALVNGIFNLNPERERVFRELSRVMKPGGAVYAAELILREPLAPDFQVTEKNWFA
jgi:arsenite methyltransferase